MVRQKCHLLRPCPPSRSRGWRHCYHHHVGPVCGPALEDEAALGGSYSVLTVLLASLRSANVPELAVLCAGQAWPGATFAALSFNVVTPAARDAVSEKKDRPKLESVPSKTTAGSPSSQKQHATIPKNGPLLRQSGQCSWATSYSEAFNPE